MRTFVLNKRFIVFLLILMGLYFLSAVNWYWNLISFNYIEVTAEDLKACQAETCTLLGGKFEMTACRFPPEVVGQKFLHDPRMACTETGGKWFEDLRPQTVVEEALACDEGGRVHSLVKQCIIPEGCPEEKDSAPGCFCLAGQKCLKGLICVPLPEEYRQAACLERLRSNQKDKFWRWARIYSPVSFLESFIRKVLL